MEAQDGELGEVVPHRVKTVKEVADLALDGCLLADLLPEGREHLARSEGDVGEVRLVDVEGVRTFVGTHRCVDDGIQIDDLSSDRDGHKRFWSERGRGGRDRHGEISGELYS